MDKRPAFHEELYCQHLYEHAGAGDTKDIIIVVHDQLDLVKKCVESVFQNTDHFTLYLWDNNSMAPTREYLEEVARTNKNVVLQQHPTNAGFIKPNVEMMKKGKSTYVILLNSDTEVRKGWDTALIGWLKQHPNCKQVGYEGGVLEADGKGNGKAWSGSEVDYICGWCLCMERETIKWYGFFDDYHLFFAYGEDSDLSLRMKEAGFDIYALHLKLVTHVGNATSKEVQKEMDTSTSFEQNHTYIRKRYANYLATKRVMLRSPNHM
jgi:GT2 family glycosyltransferase